MCKSEEIFLRCFLAVESDKGTRVFVDFMQNKGEFLKQE